MSREHRALHKNPRTGQILQNKEQVCTGCFENFGTTEAGDSHRDLTGDKYVCLNPSDIGLIPIANKFGTMVWRVRND